MRTARPSIGRALTFFTVYCTVARPWLSSFTLDKPVGRVIWNSFAIAVPPQF
jgi:hypothetical protein